MADNNTPIEGSLANITDVTASTYTSTSTLPLNTTPSITSFKAVITSTKPAQAPILISVMKSLKKRLKTIIVVTTLAASKQDKN